MQTFFHFNLIPRRFAYLFSSDRQLYRIFAAYPLHNHEMFFFLLFFLIFFSSLSFSLSTPPTRSSGVVQQSKGSLAKAGRFAAIAEQHRFEFFVVSRIVRCQFDGDQLGGGRRRKRFVHHRTVHLVRILFRRNASPSIVRRDRFAAHVHQQCVLFVRFGPVNVSGGRMFVFRLGSFETGLCTSRGGRRILYRHERVDSSATVQQLSSQRSQIVVARQ